MSYTLTHTAASGNTAKFPSLRNVYSMNGFHIATLTIGPPLKLHSKWKERDVRKGIPFWCKPKSFYKMQKWEQLSINSARLRAIAEGLLQTPTSVRWSENLQTGPGTAALQHGSGRCIEDFRSNLIFTQDILMFSWSGFPILNVFPAQFNALKFPPAPISFPGV